MVCFFVLRVVLRAEIKDIMKNNKSEPNPNAPNVKSARRYMVEVEDLQVATDSTQMKNETSMQKPGGIMLCHSEPVLF